jgi:transposase-like protein
MTREQSNAMWQGRWEGLRSSGLTMKEYARREGFPAPSAYRWLRKARRSGLWLDEPKPGKALAVTKPSVAMFARVAVSDTPAARSSMLLRLILTNGRRAELEIGGVGQLCEVLEVLEGRA